MLHKVDVRIDAGKVKQDPVSPEILQILKPVRPSWLPENIRNKQFTGGTSNVVYGYYEDGKFEEDVVLVRIEGEGTEKMMNREQERKVMQITCILNELIDPRGPESITVLRRSTGRRFTSSIGYFTPDIVKILHEAGCCAPLYAEFNNGIAYGYIQGTTLDENTVRDKQIRKLIAKEMCRLHAVRPEGLKPVPGLWAITDVFLQLIPERFPDDPEKHNRYLENIKPKSVLEEEFKQLREHLEALHSPIVFCHNDLLVNNLIYNKEEDRIHFIDYEFAMYNYQHFDIAHHFCEYTGVSEDLDFTRYPDKAYQLEWIKNYLGFQAEQSGRTQADVTDRDIEEFYVKCNKFALASHFAAGTWALAQANMSKLDFDYRRFATCKLDEYFARKEEFFALQIPK